MLALVTAPIAEAKSAPAPAAAPIPIQILTGKKVFIANGGDSFELFDTPNLSYNEFYAQMKSWGKFELVPVPADADLVFEIRFGAPLGAVSVVKGDGGSTADLQLCLVILDPKTHILLWAMTEHIEGWHLASTGRKNFDTAIANLVNDLKKLITPPAVIPDTPSVPSK
jgi:hypothetical protein